MTGAAALMDYQCRLSGRSDDSGTVTHRRRAGAGHQRLPVQQGDQRLRGPQSARVHHLAGAASRRGRRPAAVWLEDLIEIAEASASSPVFPLLKRPDERYVTMRAHDHPVFVEDMARAAARALSDDDRMAWFSVEAVNDESIHNHAAFARIDSSQLPRREPDGSSVLPDRRGLPVTEDDRDQATAHDSPCDRHVRQPQEPCPFPRTSNSARYQARSPISEPAGGSPAWPRPAARRRSPRSTSTRESTGRSRAGFRRCTGQVRTYACGRARQATA